MHIVLQTALTKGGLEEWKERVVPTWERLWKFPKVRTFRLFESCQMKFSIPLRTQSIIILHLQLWGKRSWGFAQPHYFVSSKQEGWPIELKWTDSIESIQTWTRYCSIETNHTITADASPSHGVPSKITETFWPSISEWIRLPSSWWMSGNGEYFDGLSSKAHFLLAILWRLQFCLV